MSKEVETLETALRRHEHHEREQGPFLERVWDANLLLDHHLPPDLRAQVMQVVLDLHSDLCCFLEAATLPAQE